MRYKASVKPHYHLHPQEKEIRQNEQAKGLQKYHCLFVSSCLVGVDVVRVVCGVEKDPRSIISFISIEKVPMITTVRVLI
jgi:hypothetical protein